LREHLRERWKKIFFLLERLKKNFYFGVNIFAQRSGRLKKKFYFGAKKKSFQMLTQWLQIGVPLSEMSAGSCPHLSHSRIHFSQIATTPLGQHPSLMTCLLGNSS